MTMMVHHVCSSCGAEHDSATSVFGRADPSPGDITVCIKCGHVMAFADDMTARELTDEEVRAIAGDPRLLRAQKIRESFTKLERSDED